MTKIFTIAAELFTVGLVAAGVSLTFGVGPALTVAGALLLAGIELYGIKRPSTDEDEDEDGPVGLRITYDPDANSSSDDRRLA